MSALDSYSTGDAPQKWNRIKALFGEALEIDRAIRLSWLKAKCHDDPALADELASLLENDHSNDRFLETPAWWSANLSGIGAGPVEEAPILRSDAMVGSWRILEEISSGGMGTVYLAERTIDEDDEPVRQRAAIKVIRARVDTQLFAGRFRRERRILAHLNHPFIARFLEGGTLENGLPYFALDYVEGERIDCYCRNHQLDHREILKLFCKVCSAVAYAHRNFVVHRDLKPSNMLVVSDGTPRLLDFGIAKLLAEENESLEQTKGLGPCTPRYSSPEQIRGEPVTTASDVFVLGIILHELMTGVHPFHRDENGPTTAFEVLRRICEDEPEKLQDRLERRKIGLQNSCFGRLERGDLQSIILKALQKRPADRYKNVEYLVDDIQNLLERRPVTARPQRWWYRTRTLIRRHPSAALSISATIVIGFMAFSFMVVSDRAVRKERDYALQQRELAASSARTMMNDLASALQNMSAPIERRLELLKRVAGVFDRIDATSRSDIDISRKSDQFRAEVQTELTLASALQELGDYQSALLHSELAELRAKEILARRDSTADDEVTLARAVSEKCRALFKSGNVNVAAEGLERSIAVLRELSVRRLRTSSQSNLESALCDALTALAMQRKDHANPEGIERMLLEAVQSGERAYMANPMDRSALNSYASSLECLGNAYCGWARFDLVTTPIRKALAIRRQAVAESPGDIELQQRLDRAIAFSGSSIALTNPQNTKFDFPGESLSMLRKLCAADPNNAELSQNLFRELGNYGTVLVNKNEPEKAKPLLRESLEIAKKLTDQKKAPLFCQDYAVGYGFTLFLCYRRTDQIEAAREINREVLIPFTTKLAQVDADKCSSRLRQYFCCFAQAELAGAIGNWSEAQQMYALALRNVEENLEERDYPYEREIWGDCLARYGDALGRIGNIDSACRYIEQGLQAMCALRTGLRLFPATLTDISDAEEALKRYKSEANTTHFAVDTKLIDSERH
jgi:serine/threonine protein kinase